MESAGLLIENQFKLFTTIGTHDFFDKNSIHSTQVNWPVVPKMPNAYELIQNKQIDLVINNPKDQSSEELSNDYTIRRAAVDFNIPLITNARLASAFIFAITRYKMNDLVVKSWEEYHN